jgi:hypothetical protein
MVDLNLKREMSFGTFAKELTGLWGTDDLDTPKGPRQGMFAAQPSPGGAGKPSRNDNFDMNLLMRSDSKELLGQPLTRSKSKECLLGNLPIAPAANATSSTAFVPPDGARLTRSQSKEKLLLGSSAKPGTDLIRVDSKILAASFDMSDLLGPDFMAPVNAPAALAPPKAAQQTSQKHSNPTGNKASQAKRPRNGSNNSTAKKSKKTTEPGIDGDDWIGKQVKLTRGKYEGRSAVVLGKTEKKYQVQVEGVAYQLEFYGTMFVRPEDYKPAAPKRSRKKATQQVSNREMSFGLTASQNDISAL